VVKVVAELSGNHGGRLENAMALVEAAAQAGCWGVKLQTYTADTMTLDCDLPAFRIDANSGSLWAGRTLYNLYQEAMTPWEWHSSIFARCQALGMVGFSSVFDRSALAYLEALPEALRPALYKVASFELVDLPLIAAVAQTQKSVWMSTGMASLPEIEAAVSTAQHNGCKNITLLKCTSSYPASPKDTHLRTLADMQQHFPDCAIGLSDHTLGLGVAVAAVALGATVIEKHLTLERSAGGVDAAFSMEPNEMAQLVCEVNRATEALGEVRYGAESVELQSLAHRRSILATCDIQPGDRFSEDNICCLRPGHGLAPALWDDLIGKPAARFISRGTGPDHPTGPGRVDI